MKDGHNSPPVFRSVPRNGCQPVLKKEEAVRRELRRGRAFKLHGYITDMGSSNNIHFPSKLDCISTLSCTFPPSYCYSGRVSLLQPRLSGLHRLHSHTCIMHTVIAAQAFTPWPFDNRLKVDKVWLSRSSEVKNRMKVWPGNQWLVSVVADMSDGMCLCDDNFWLISADKSLTWCLRHSTLLCLFKVSLKYTH